MIEWGRGDNVKKICFTVLLCLIGFSLVACEQDTKKQVDIEEYKYESSYAKNYNFSIGVINEIYYNYHDVFAGVYLIDGGYNINITFETPQNIISKLEQNNLVTHHLVDFSFAELWTVREIVTAYIIGNEGFCGIGISEMDNSVMLTLKTNTVIPTPFHHYIETGILTVEFTDLIIKHN